MGVGKEGVGKEGVGKDGGHGAMFPEKKCGTMCPRSNGSTLFEYSDTPFLDRKTTDEIINVDLRTFTFYLCYKGVQTLHEK